MSSREFDDVPLRLIDGCCGTPLPTSATPVPSKMSLIVAFPLATIGIKISVKKPLNEDSYAYWLSRQADKHMTCATASVPSLGSKALVCPRVVTCLGLDATTATRARSAARAVIIVDLDRTPAMPTMGATYMSGLVF